MEEEGYECQDNPDDSQDLADVGGVVRETAEAEDGCYDGDDEEDDGPIEHRGIPFEDDVKSAVLDVREERQAWLREDLRVGIREDLGPAGYSPVVTFSNYGGTGSHNKAIDLFAV